MQSRCSCSPFLLVVGLFSFSAALHGGDARTANVYRLQNEQAIQVDGILDEAIWHQHETIGELIQAIPRSGEEPTERTDVRMAFDDNAVYIAVHCFDRLPEGIVAQEMSRDARLFNDDYIQLLLDTFHDGRNAYCFLTNPLGDARGRPNHGERPPRHELGQRLVRAGPGRRRRLDGRV